MLIEHTDEISAKHATILELMLHNSFLAAFSPENEALIKALPKDCQSSLMLTYSIKMSAKLLASFFLSEIIEDAKLESFLQGVIQAIIDESTWIINNKLRKEAMH